MKAVDANGNKAGELRSLVVPALAVLVTFAGVGVGVAHGILHHEAASRTPHAELRLAAMMAGLFAGGLAATLLTLLLAFGRKRR